MLTRRAVSIQLRNASNGRASSLRRSSQGSSMSLEIIVDSATLATITMPVAAEAPPMKASTARVGLFCASGRLITKESGSTPAGSSSCPARPMGSTNSAARMR